jgi:hypothetical protein
MVLSLLAGHFGGISLLEDCNRGTAKRNPGPCSFARGHLRHHRCARVRAAPAPWWVLGKDLVQFPLTRVHCEGTLQRLY